MDFNMIKDFVIVLMAIFGFIMSFGGVINLFLGWYKGSKTKKNEEIIKDHEIRIAKLEDKTKEQESFIKVLCNSILAIVSHEINGNSIEKLKEAQSELEHFLIDK